MLPTSPFLSLNYQCSDHIDEQLARHIGQVDLNDKLTREKGAETAVFLCSQRGERSLSQLFTLLTSPAPSIPPNLYQRHPLQQSAHDYEQCKDCDYLITPGDRLTVKATDVNENQWFWLAYALTSEHRFGVAKLWSGILTTETVITQDLCA
ncbi:hypothetical protein ARMSODRAFT_1021083 [Armillaria solidipes]|uniref:Uncharacterized protein n=1 Tax=Armillaria solidipes TaxID=1076256 RepID=A0A2H3BKQ6_9AGAR|nr:hypothetical protein ARMSODRAFT_1021083 [Armillaria solidipes]